MIHLSLRKLIRFKVIYLNSLILTVGCQSLLGICSQGNPTHSRQYLRRWLPLSSWYLARKAVTLIVSEVVIKFSMAHFCLKMRAMITYYIIVKFPHLSIVASGNYTSISVCGILYITFSLLCNGLYSTDPIGLNLSNLWDIYYFQVNCRNDVDAVSR